MGGGHGGYQGTSMVEEYGSAMDLDRDKVREVDSYKRKAGPPSPDSAQQWRRACFGKSPPSPDSVQPWPRRAYSSSSDSGREDEDEWASFVKVKYDLEVVWSSSEEEEEEGETKGEVMEEDEEEDEDEDEDEEVAQFKKWYERRVMYYRNNGSGPIEKAKSLVERPSLSPVPFTICHDRTPPPKAALAEVFSVRVSGINGTPTSVFGSVIVRGSCGYVSVYHKEIDQPDCLKPEEGFLTLNGPYRAIGGRFTVSIYVDLRMKDENSSEEKELSRGVIYWDPMVEWYDSIYKNTVHGKHGCAEVTYAVFVDGVQAHVEAKLLGRKVKHLPVKLTARTKMFSNQEIVLFDGELSGHVADVESIPLNRSVLAVPVNSGSSLKIEGFLGPDKVKYTVVFDSARCLWSGVRSEGPYGVLAIKVSWWSSFDPYLWWD